MVKDFFSSVKKIYDSVHGFIRFDNTIKELIDSPAFQRLHYIKQLGIAYLVYPGATHTRFEHSLGVMDLASKIFHSVCKNARPDIFSIIPRKGSFEYHYWLKILRLAALCHDLGHIPFSHVAEKELLGEEGHEKITEMIIRSEYLSPIWQKVQQELDEILPGRNVVDDIVKISIGDKDWLGATFTSWEKIVSQIITGDFFGADRIDYLLRDSKSTGVGYGIFDYDQLIEMIRILPVPDGKEDELALGINENGLEACEALLLARHFMHRRVYQYPSVKAYNFHLKRFMQMLYSKEDFTNLSSFFHLTDVEVIGKLRDAANDSSLLGHNDAKRIIFRKKRFKALAMNKEFKKDDLQYLQEKIGIPEDSLHWEGKVPLMKEHSLSFPVSKRHLMVEKADECSELLCKVGSSNSGWLYFDPSYELPILQHLQNAKK